MDGWAGALGLIGGIGEGIQGGMEQRRLWDEQARQRQIQEEDRRYARGLQRLQLAHQYGLEDEARGAMGDLGLGEDFIGPQMARYFEQQRTKQALDEQAARSQGLGREMDSLRQIGTAMSPADFNAAAQALYQRYGVSVPTRTQTVKTFQGPSGPGGESLPPLTKQVPITFMPPPQPMTYFSQPEGSVVYAAPKAGGGKPKVVAPARPKTRAPGGGSAGGQGHAPKGMQLKTERRADGVYQVTFDPNSGRIVSERKVSGPASGAADPLAGLKAALGAPEGKRR